MLSRCCLLCFLTALALAQSAPPSIETRISNLEAAVKSAQSAGDNAWMLISAALVLMMTGPGLALFYGGLVRRKNVLGTMMHSFILMAVVTVLWAVVGYSLAFGEGIAVHRRSALSVPERRRRARPIPITPPPFRSRPSWSISSCSPSSRRR